MAITPQSIRTFRLLAVSVILFLGITGCKSNLTSVSNTDKKPNEVKSEKEEIKLKNTFINANRFKIKGDLETALVYFDRCLKIDPEHGASLFEVAQIKLNQRQHEEALSFAERAVEQDDSNRWYLAFYAHLLDQSNQNEKAAAVYSKLIEQNPNQIEYYYELANNYLLTNQLQKAIDTYNQIEDKVGVTDQISEQKQKLYLNLGKEEKAIEELKQLIAFNPKKAQYYGQLAGLYKQLGRKKDAIETYEKLQRFDPDNPLVQLSLYEYYLEGGENEKAYGMLRSAFGHPDLSIDTKVEVLLSYYSPSENDENLKALVYDLCDSVITTHPNDPKGFAVTGDFFNRDQKLEEARGMFRKALALDQSRFMIGNELLFINAQLQDYNALVNESEQAMELFPSQPSVYLYHGIGHMQNENYSEAVLAFEQGKGLVIQNNALKVQFLANLGDAYQKMGKYQQSYLNYDLALELEPNNTYVLNNYAYFLSLNNENLIKARQMAELCVKKNPKSSSYLDTYAWVLYQLKSYDLALEKIEEAYRMGGSKSAEVVEHYGDILFRLDRQSEALEKWKEANLLEESDQLKEKIRSKKLEN